MVKDGNQLVLESMSEQLIKKNCSEGTYKNIYPITVFSAVRDEHTEESLKTLLESFNHLYLPFKDNSKSATRVQVPLEYRKKGMWITYNACNKTVTEWYKGDDFSDTEWSNSSNWVPYIDTALIEEQVKSNLSWYKA